MITAVKVNYTDKFEEERKHWGGGHRGHKSIAKLEGRARALGQDPTKVSVRSLLVARFRTAIYSFVFAAHRLSAFAYDLLECTRWYDVSWASWLSVDAATRNPFFVKLYFSIVLGFMLSELLWDHCDVCEEEDAVLRKTAQRSGLENKLVFSSQQSVFCEGIKCSDSQPSLVRPLVVARSAMVPPLFFSNAGPETPTGESSASSVSPPSSSSSPRSSRHRDELGSAFVDNFAEVGDSEEFASSNSDSYDSAGEYGRITPFGNPSGIGSFSSGGEGEEEGSFSSRVSSRVGSPVPPEVWEGYRPELLSYRAVVSRRGSRHPSGTTTPTNGADKEASADCTSPLALLQPR